MGSLMLVALCRAMRTNEVMKTERSTAPAACCQSQSTRVNQEEQEEEQQEQEEQLTTILLGL